MWWVWLLYALTLVIVIFVSNKIGGIVDALDKKTKLSGAFLGAVLLAGVTSLPELVTSLTAAIMGEPDMTQGNILGSNVFDIAIIGLLLVIYFKRIKTRSVSKANIIFDFFVFAITAAILLLAIFNVQIVIPYININILTPLIIVLYIVALFATRKSIENIEDEEQGATNKFEEKSVKTLAWSFVAYSVVLVGVSVALTFLAEYLAEQYGLAKGLAGALFLGVPTSLPEIISSFALLRYGNFNAAYGNIIGSCLFNYAVLAIADIAFIHGTVFVTDLQTIILSACLLVATSFMIVLGLVKRGNNKIKNTHSFHIIMGALILITYVVFLIMSALYC